MNERNRSGARVVIVHHASWAEIRKAHPENVMAPLTLGYAVSLLERRGHHVTLVDTETGAYTEESLRAVLRTQRPDVVVLDGITPAVPSILRTARFIRETLPRVFLVASGQHATARPDDFFAEPGLFDACATVEYEEALTEAVDAWAAGGAALADVAGLVLPPPGPGSPVRRNLARPLREDLDALPFPSHALFMRREYNVFHPTDVTRTRRWGFIMSSRGCPYPCLYCSPTLRNSYGRGMRWRSVDSVVDEMEHLVRLGVTVLHFKDDIFTVNRARTMELCERMRGRGVKLSWTVQTRADCVDVELLRAMRAAGCCTVSMGIESGSPRILEVLRKKETVEDSIRAAEAARAAGLYLVNFFLLANPTETMEDLEATLAVAKRLDPDILQVGFFTPYPGSPYYEEAYRAQDAHAPGEFSHYNKIINLSAVPTDALYAFQRRFYLEFISRPRFAARFLRHRLRGLPSNLDSELQFFRLSSKFLMRSVGARLVSQRQARARARAARAA